MAVTGACGALAVAACDVNPAQDVGPGSSFVEQRLTRSGWNPVDLLLVVDDSASMAERPYVAEATAEMVRRLVAPPCVDDRGVEVEPPARVAPGGGCPAGTRPAWAPVTDLNVGVITTSIGAAGRADRCVGDGGAEVVRGDAAAHLMTRWASDAIDDVATWQDRGFLAWDPLGVRRCGTTPDAYCAGLDDRETLVARVQTLVEGVGTGGCGDEAPLEAAWRFLGDPAPSLGVDEVGEPFGVDGELLAQREAFLRPLSRVVVALITDEDDCSFRRDGVGRYGTDPGSPMPRPRAECADGPEHACCNSCIEQPPDGCVGDGGCELPGCQDPVTCPGNFHATSSENDRQWRCRDPKRRFGLDLLYPPQRYVNAFNEPLVNPHRLDLAPDGVNDVPNLLASDHDVHLLTVGPIDWEIIARRTRDGTPDLVRGLDEQGHPRGGYRTVSELSRHGVWDALLADDPGNDAPLRLAEVARLLGGGGWAGSDRSSVASIDPPRVTAEGPRLLDVGFEAAAAEVAPSSPCGSSWRGANRDRSDLRFQCGGGCFPAPLAPDASGEVACHVLEARDSDGDGNPTSTARCACDPGATRLDLDGEQARYADWIRERLLEEDSNPGYDCFCAIPQVPGAPDDPSSPRHACLHDELPGAGVDGWCYLDASAGLGNPDLLVACPPSEQRLIRFVGEGELRGSSRVHIGCVAP